MEVITEMNKQLKNNESNLLQEKQTLQKQLQESNNELNNVMHILKDCEDMYKSTLTKQETVIENLS